MAMFNYESEQLKPYVEANPDKHKYLCEYHHELFESGVPHGTFPEMWNDPYYHSKGVTITITNRQAKTTWQVSESIAWANVICTPNVVPNEKLFIRLYNKPDDVYRVYIGDVLQELTGDYAIITSIGYGTTLHVYTTNSTHDYDKLNAMDVLVCEYVDGMENMNVPHGEGTYQATVKAE